MSWQALAPLHYTILFYEKKLSIIIDSSGSATPCALMWPQSPPYYHALNFPRENTANIYSSLKYQPIPGPYNNYYENRGTGFPS